MSCIYILKYHKNPASASVGLIMQLIIWNLNYYSHRLIVSLCEALSSFYITKKEALAFLQVLLPGGDEGDRTPYLLNAIQALSQVSYTPMTYSLFVGHSTVS